MDNVYYVNLVIFHKFSELFILFDINVALFGQKVESANQVNIHGALLTRVLWSQLFVVNLNNSKTIMLNHLLFMEVVKSMQQQQLFCKFY